MVKQLVQFDQFEITFKADKDEHGRSRLIVTMGQDGPQRTITMEQIRRLQRLLTAWFPEDTEK